MGNVEISIYKINSGFQIKSQSQMWELNIWLTKEDFYALENIRGANWDKRGSIKAGKSAKSNTFWCFNNEFNVISILVGEDDESWDFAVRFPPEQFEKLINKHINE